MIKIEDFIRMLDKDYEPLQSLIDKGMVRKEAKKVEDLNPNEEFQKYLKERIYSERFTQQNCRNLLLNECSRYKRPYIINNSLFEVYPGEESLGEVNNLIKDLSETEKENTGKQLANLLYRLHFQRQDPNDQVYVYVTMAQPGKHRYIVRFNQELQEDTESDFNNLFDPRMEVVK
jgi:hypothetical protein